MKKTICAVLLAAVAIPMSMMAAAAKSVTTASTPRATVTPAQTAQAQLAEASRLWKQMEQTPAPQKFTLFAQAWSNLALVRKAWPNDKNAFVRSGIMQADLAGEFRLWNKAIGALQEILPATSKTAMEPQVEQKLGKAYEESGNAALAETHFLAAERAMRSTHVNRVESEAVLGSVALFYARHNKPAEAISRFREAANLPGQDAINKLHYQLSAAEQAARVGRDAAAPELSRFDDLVVAARKTNLSPVDATLVNHMTAQAQRIRDNAHL